MLGNRRGIAHTSQLELTRTKAFLLSEPIPSGIFNLATCYCSVYAIIVRTFLMHHASNRSRQWRVPSSKVTK